MTLLTVAKLNERRGDARRMDGASLGDVSAPVEVLKAEERKVRMEESTKFFDSFLFLLIFFMD